MIDSSDDPAIEEASSLVDLAFDEARIPTPLRAGAAIIHAFWKTLPNSPGVYG